jgi:hypothetical protein
MSDSLCEGPVWSKRTGDGTEQLIHGQLAWERKVLDGESIACGVYLGKPVLEPVWTDWTWLVQKIEYGGEFDIGPV